MRLPLSLLLALSACAEADLDAMGGAEPTGAPFSPLDAGTYTNTPSPPATYAPITFWSLHGQATVIGEALDPAALSLEIRLWTEDLTSPCSLPLPIDTKDLIELAPFPETSANLIGWWSIDHGESTSADPGCAGWPAGTLELGVGSYDPRLDPAMEARNWLDVDVYGLYLRTAPASPVYLVGVVGTLALFEGDEPTVSAAPLPDETYDLETLVVLDLP
ncbi:MAG TPA: hypothetical protein ENK18_21745 [Deltaproteobacteria bacterium]|nr:hypothetical protein [Deltaproteobacteria bacterium]